MKVPVFVRGNHIAIPGDRTVVVVSQEILDGLLIKNVELAVEPDKIRLVLVYHFLGAG